ncbi:DNA-binding IclR family transcriptional regulator [Herbaspirillum rubrisubalbicans]|nr:DNA-binding IclR family transcriptional regulator [Herbaspirillum rubrisubalbicans]
MSYTVDAVSKAIELLFLVAEEGGNGVTELAKRSGNTKARAFRLLTTLEECGLVRRQLPMATYSLGYRALILGTAAQGQLNLVNVARDILEDIGNECNESVLVRVRDGMDTVCVALVGCSPCDQGPQSTGRPPSLVCRSLWQVVAGVCAGRCTGRDSLGKAGEIHPEHHRQAD